MDGYENERRGAEIFAGAEHESGTDIGAVVLRDLETYGAEELSQPDFAAACALDAYDYERGNITGAENYSQTEFLADYFYRLEQALARQLAPA